MTGQSVTVISTNEQLFTSLSTLDPRSIVNCRIRLSPGEEHLLVDFIERGITLIPSANAQLASRSKIHQARIFSQFMLPNTVVAYNANDLLKHISDYNIAGVEEVVVKRDRKNGGLGVHYFPSVEEVYNFATFANLEYPIVLQPFAKEFKDIRVIALGEEYSEAYERSNSANFRHNLHCGGQATPYEISEKMVKFCQQVMNRGKFPYAHIDLMQMDSGAIHLIEINLRGGLRGAQIDSNQYKEVINKIHHKLVDRAQAELS